ncbi:MAG: DUF4197 domain-containing protein, partial [Gammaproteobacteria bacterium]|nr:DUF4197 domain-containing protein [Gammaproteobacteria bacterium]
MLRLIGLALMVLIVSPATAGWRDMLDSVSKTLGSGDAVPETITAGTLSEAEIIKGLKEALGQGVSAAVSNLGRADGFLGNPDVRIPVPGRLESVASTLRGLGQEQLVDNFVNTMNHAAEAAVPEAAELFANAISQMSLEAARGILQGPDDAATQ